jgi:hypothetical protein
MALTFLTSIQNALNGFLVNKAFLKELNWLPKKVNPTKNSQYREYNKIRP